MKQLLVFISIYRIRNSPLQNFYYFYTYENLYEVF